MFHGSGALNKSGSSVLAQLLRPHRTAQHPQPSHPGVRQRRRRDHDRCRGRPVEQGEGQPRPVPVEHPGGQGLASLIGDSASGIDKALNFVDASGKGGLSFAHDMGWV
ncbi:hypothetical protein [Microbacterium elymi]|uniref:Uncharacterized protein n=1 Tax=Microbacterium elymi TaxID=2909587 RepID=A0ABY5NL23_9MICO|nr:hypothetical protein [Microbacterium elymi]UUT35829.1 hypothetical protein L2X98_21870 [Microbacterium elymi]